MNTTSTTLSPEQEARARAAFESTAPARAALVVENLPPFTLNVPYAVGKALYTSAKCLPFRPRFLDLKSVVDVGHLDQLETYALALNAVHTEILRRVQVLGQVPELAKEGFVLRAQMMGYAELLSNKGRIAAALIARLREGAGYRDLAEDLNVLVSELGAQPPGVIGEMTPVSDADLRRASELAYEILRRVGNPAEIDMTQDALLQERRKLGALLVEAQDQVRCAMTALRWKQKDVDTYVPSLYVPGGARKAEAEAAGMTDSAAAVQGPPAAPAHPDDNPFVTEE